MWLGVGVVAFCEVFHAVDVIRSLRKQLIEVRKNETGVIAWCFESDLRATANW